MLYFLQIILHNAIIWRELWFTTQDLLIKKFNTINYSNSKEDVLPFIKDKTKFDIWSKEFFIDITKNLKDK